MGKQTDQFEITNFGGINRAIDTMGDIPQAYVAENGYFTKLGDMTKFSRRYGFKTLNYSAATKNSGAGSAISKIYDLDKNFIISDEMSNNNVLAFVQSGSAGSLYSYGNGATNATSILTGMDFFRPAALTKYSSNYYLGAMPQRGYLDTKGTDTYAAYGAELTSSGNVAVMTNNYFNFKFSSTTNENGLRITKASTSWNLTSYNPTFSLTNRSTSSAFTIRVQLSSNVAETDYKYWDITTQKDGRSFTTGTNEIEVDTSIAATSSGGAFNQGAVVKIKIGIIFTGATAGDFLIFYKSNYQLIEPITGNYGLFSAPDAITYTKITGSTVPKYVTDLTQFDGKLFVIYKNLVYYNNTVGDTSAFTNFSVDDADNDELVACKTLGKYLFLFKRRSIYKLIATENTLLPYYREKIYSQDSGSGIGCVARDTVKNIVISSLQEGVGDLEYIIFLSYFGIYAISEFGKPTKISKSVDALLTDKSLDYVTTNYTATVRDREYVLCIPDSPSLLLHFDSVDKQWTTTTIAETVTAVSSTHNHDYLIPALLVGYNTGYIAMEYSNITQDDLITSTNVYTTTWTSLFSTFKNPRRTKQVFSVSVYGTANRAISITVTNEKGQTATATGTTDSTSGYLQVDIGIEGILLKVSVSQAANATFDLKSIGMEFKNLGAGQ